MEHDEWVGCIVFAFIIVWLLFVLSLPLGIAVIVYKLLGG